MRYARRNVFSIIVFGIGLSLLVTGSVCATEQPESFTILSSNMQQAREIIVTAIHETAAAHGEWWRAYGLLGTTRMPHHPDEALYTYLGYFSLFHTAVLSVGRTKLENSVQLGRGNFVLLYNKASHSWVYQREYFIRQIGEALYKRFTFNEKGAYARRLKPLPKHQSMAGLKNILPDAYALYTSLRGKRFHDGTFGDAIGIAYAFLTYDGIQLDGFEKLPSHQEKYQQARVMILKHMQEGKPFFEALSEVMHALLLHYEDVIAIPPDQKKHKAVVALIEEDLARLDKIIRTAPKEKREAPPPLSADMLRIPLEEEEKPPPFDEEDFYNVQRVIDGDTLYLEFDQHVKMIGVETPEKTMSSKLRRDAAQTGKDEKHLLAVAQEAIDFTRSLCEGKRVRLEYEDVHYQDGYGRLLAYVYLEDGTLVNAEIIKNGFGYVYERFPFKHVYEFKELQAEAVHEQRGLWKE